MIPSAGRVAPSGNGAAHARLPRVVEILESPLGSCAAGCDFAQQRIDESPRRSFARCLRHLHGFVDHRRLRNLGEELNLVHAQAQYRRHLGVKSLDRLAGNFGNPKIQLPAPTQNAHHDLGRQSPVGILQLGNFRGLQEIDGEPPARFDVPEDSIGG